MTISEPTTARDLELGGFDREAEQFSPNIPAPASSGRPADLDEHEESHLIRGYD